MNRPMRATLAAACLLAVLDVRAEEKPESVYAGLPFRFLGPPGNRVSAVAGVPGDANTCYAGAASGGVWKSTDAGGGKRWERALFGDEGPGVSDLAAEPSNPRGVFAGAWPIDIKTWGRKSGGAGGGLYVSRDGGATWKRITEHGLPDPPIGKVAV